MPQIEQLASTYSSQIFWLLVFFGLVFFLVGRGMVPKVMDTVAQRDSQISADLAAAEAARNEADAQEEAWRQRENENRAQAHAMVSEAKDKAAHETEHKLAAAQEQLDARVAEAERRIEAARSAAATEIQAVASDAAQDIVLRLTGMHIAEATASAAVRKAMIHG